MNFSKNKKNLLLISILFLVLFVVLPASIHAQNNYPGLFIKCGSYTPGSGTSGGTLDECDFADLLTLVNNVLNWLVMISFSVVIITLSWAGIMMVTSGGNTSQKDRAKGMLMSIVKGFFFILAARLIVYTITNILLKSGIVVP